MYLEYFGLNEFPFALTPNCSFYCSLTSHQEALDVLKYSIKNGEGFIKIIGEVGTGKTLLCRKLLSIFEVDANYATAYVVNPNLDSYGLYEALANELGVETKTKKTKQNELLGILNERLLELYKQNKKVVVFIDEAQVIPFKTLESLRLLSNLETESTKLLQMVLFGQPELNQRLAKNELRQLNQRIAFSYNLRPLKRSELDEYILHRLKVAGYNSYSSLFTKKACDLLFRASRGIPRLINILCHKSLLATYGYNYKKVNFKSMLLAVKDTESAYSALKKNVYYLLLLAVLVLEIAVIFFALRIA